MTLSTTTNRIAYAGDGATAAFAVPYPFLANAHVQAILRAAGGAEMVWTEGTHYTLAGAGQPAGGTLTAKAAPVDFRPKAGETLVIRRVVPATQETDYPEGGAFPAKAHEDALDKLTMLVQQHAEQIARTLLLPATSAAANLALPEPASGRFVRWRADLGGLENADVTGQGAIGLPVAIADGGTNATTAAGARASLDAQEDVFTTRGDLARRGAAATERLALGAAGQVLTSDGADPVWAPAALPRGYIDGFVLANNAGDAVNDIDVAPGAARDDANAADLAAAATVVKQLDAAFAEYAAPGTPSGGRDPADNLTGAKWFHVYVIGGAGKNPQPYLSTATAPTLPSGFTSKRRVGSVRWDGAAVVPFSQRGEEFLWKDPPLDVDVTNFGTLAVLRTLTVPIGFIVEAIMNVYQSGSNKAYLSSPSVNDEVGSITVGPLSTFVVSANNLGARTSVRTDASAQIRTRFDTSGTGETLRIATLGWTDHRGKDA
jgi:hypothetical protein